MARKEESQESALQLLRKDLREKNTKRLYFFYVEEAYLRQYYFEQLKKQKIDKATEAFNFRKLNGDTFSLQALSDGVEAVPMMAESTLVQVDDIDIFKLGEEDRNRLAELFSDIPDYCTLVFTYETVEWKVDGRFKKLADAVTKCGTQVEFPKQTERDLISWIGRHFAAAGKRISPNLCTYLIDITDGTMTSLGSEIQKICAFSGAEEIVRQDIDAVVEPVPDAVVFQIAELIADRQPGKALQKLTQVLKMQQEPIAVLGTISAHFRKLGVARTLTDTGKGQGELQKLYRMGDYAARKTMQAASRFSPRFYAATAELLVETDRKMKTSADDPKRLLEVLLLEISREAQNG